MLDVTLGESRSSTNDVFVVTVFGNHGYSAAAESGFVVVHDRSVIVGVSEGVDFSGLVEVKPHVGLDVAPVNRKVVITIWTALLVVESYNEENVI